MTFNKVKDVLIQEDKFVVQTDVLYAIASGSGSRYHIGEFNIEINMGNTHIRFHNTTNKRRGYWSMDSHPHVNGDTGEACLGSVAPTIAELCSQGELYALSLVLIDFLENANTSDSAGRHVVAWDKVDKDGKVIESGRGLRDREREEEIHTCDVCDEEVDETLYGYNVDSDGDLVNRLDVCAGCAEEYYHFSNHFNDLIHNDYGEENN